MTQAEALAVLEHHERYTALPLPPHPIESSI